MMAAVLPLLAVGTAASSAAGWPQESIREAKERDIADRFRIEVMDDGLTAKQLLAHSYQRSVMRIRDALRGELTIEDQRSIPPKFPGEVVGFCGQGGRHPYFKIPADVLDVALTRIERVAVGDDGPSVERAMEEITGACQELRQRTYFDGGTGCVNDSLPSMVALLPPEEIWFDLRQLPMDVWRLICFEFDLVSSSVASRVSVEDFAFSAVNQSALAFRLLLDQLGGRRVAFKVEFDKVPAGWGLAGPYPSTKNVSLARIFFEAGRLLTPLATDDFTKGYGAVRYFHWVDAGKSELRVRDEFKGETVDCRYRGLFAEETAIGLMAVVLKDDFGAELISNTVEAAPSHSLVHGEPVADFVAEVIDPTNSKKTTIIAESKGSLGDAVSRARHLRAKKQLEATKKVFTSGSVQLIGLTFGSTIRFSKQRAKSGCVVTDPPVAIETGAIELDPVWAWRVVYAKTLKFVGMETAAQQVLRGAHAEAIRPIDFDRRRDRRRSDRDRQRLRRASAARERFQMDLILDVGRYALGLDTAVMGELRRGIDGESPARLTEILNGRRELAGVRFRRDSFETSLGFGCVAYSDLDAESVRDNTPEG